LWASTGTKNPAFRDVLYIESLIAPGTVNTVPPETLTAFVDHGRAASTLEQNFGEAQQVIKTLDCAGIDLDQVTDKLLTDGSAGFVESFENLMLNIEDKRVRLLARSNQRSRVNSGA
jgi:transaldolase